MWNFRVERKPRSAAIYEYIRSISRLPTTAENYQNVRMEGLTRLQEHRLELQHRLDMHRTMEMPPSPSPSSRSLAPFSSASSSLSEGSNQPSGEDSASIVTGIFIHTGLFTIAAFRGAWPLVCRDSREGERKSMCVYVRVHVTERKKERERGRVSLDRSIREI